MLLQYDESSCGPIAIMNACEYLNKKCGRTRRTVHKLREICDTNEYVGTMRWNIENNGVLNLGKAVYIKERIKKMKAFILLYSGVEFAHYVFVVNNNVNYTVYNYIHNDQYVHKILSTSEFDDLLRANPIIDGLNYPVAWKIC